MIDWINIYQKGIFEYIQNYNKNLPKEKQIWLNANDIIIFDYIAQFCLSDNEKIKDKQIKVNNEIYTYVAYKKIIEDNPILYISTTSKNKIAKRIKKLEKLGLLKKNIYIKREIKYILSYYQIVPRVCTERSDNSKLNIESNNSKKKE